jgi:hypothetical protein
MSEPTAPETPPAAPAAQPAEPAPPKIKPKKVTQRACDEKDEKGKLCCGHLKRWYDYPKTIYKPDTSQPPHSYTLRY